MRREKRLDRFERVVKKKLDDILEPVSVESQFRDSILGSVAVNLLRAEHRWMVRIIKDHLSSMITIRKGLQVEGNTPWMDGYRMACEEFLSQLTQRRK